ncbi:TonB family protein [Burkholderia metallica]|nr:TonB family protein [Burkholderia metallica]MCA8020075.1 TonB family protein [Burkholderia metallica]
MRSDARLLTARDEHDGRCERGHGAMDSGAIDMHSYSYRWRGSGGQGRPGGMRIVLAVAATCVMHAGVFMLLAREPVARSVPVQRRLMMAILIAPAPEGATRAPVAAPSKAASRALHRAVPAARSSQSGKSPAIKPVAPDRAGPPAHDASTPLRPVPAATSVERRSMPDDDPSPNAGQTRAVSHAIPASALPRFVVHPECVLAPPDYPPQSLRTGEHGTALVELETDAAGRVVAARVVTGSGYPRLDAAAREAALASRCTPYLENGAPSPMRARVPVTFNLDE